MSREIDVFTLRRVSESATSALKAVVEDQTPDQRERSDKHLKAYYALAFEDYHREAADSQRLAEYRPYSRRSGRCFAMKIERSRSRMNVISSRTLARYASD